MQPHSVIFLSMLLTTGTRSATHDWKMDFNRSLDSSTNSILGVLKEALEDPTDGLEELTKGLKIFHDIFGLLTDTSGALTDIFGN